VSSPKIRLPASKRQLSLLGTRLAGGTAAPGDDELYAAMLDVYDRVQQSTRSAIENIELVSVSAGNSMSQVARRR
jgi:hypothetical protein